MHIRHVQPLQWLAERVCVRSGCLGECIERCSNVEEALKQYEAKRLPQTSQEVLFSRHLGRMKQALDDRTDWRAASAPKCKQLAQANMSSFEWRH